MRGQPADESGDSDQNNACNYHQIRLECDDGSRGLLDLRVFFIGAKHNLVDLLTMGFVLRLQLLE